MNDLIFSNGNKYLFEHTHSELKAKAEESLGVVNRTPRQNGIQSGFFSLLDGVAAEASAGNNIIGEYPGFYRAMMDDEKLFDTFIEEVNKK